MIEPAFSLEQAYVKFAMGMTLDRYDWENQGMETKDSGHTTRLTGTNVNTLTWRIGWRPRSIWGGSHKASSGTA
jgi:hypothetical protein